MTKQQAFDVIWNWFVVDKNPRSSSGIGCFYRVFQEDRVLKCGVGALIPDNLYDPALDTGDFIAIRDILDPKIQVQNKFGPELVNFLNTELLPIEEDFLTEIQIIHDTGYSERYFTQRMESELRKLADAHELKIPK